MLARRIKKNSLTPPVPFEYRFWEWKEMGRGAVVYCMSKKQAAAEKETYRFKKTEVLSKVDFHTGPQRTGQEN